MDSPDQTHRTLTLLWRSAGGETRPRTPGPRPRLDIDSVVEAGISVADANGSGEVSMRGVAERLGVTAMTLYGYVPGKEALVCLMYDAIHAELPSDHRYPGGWRQRVRAWADDLMELYLRHPWALHVSNARPVLGPHEQHTLEAVVRILRDTGLEPGLVRRVVGTLFHVVRGTARTIAEGRRAAETSGVTEEEWWQGASAALGAVVPDFADRFPHTMWLLAGPADAGADDDPGGYVDDQARANLSVGLDVLLDGLETAMGAVEEHP